MQRKPSRRGSEMVLSEGPITPPESPSPEDMAAAQAQQQAQAQVVKEEVPQEVQIDYPVTPISQVPETPDSRDEEMEVDSQYFAISRQPVRSLSSENLQSSDSSSLKLTDFEVRGTLGMSFSLI